MGTLIILLNEDIELGHSRFDSATPENCQNPILVSHFLCCSLCELYHSSVFKMVAAIPSTVFLYSSSKVGRSEVVVFFFSLHLFLLRRMFYPVRISLLTHCPAFGNWPVLVSEEAGRAGLFHF